MDKDILLELKVINYQLNAIRRKGILDKSLEHYYKKASEAIDED